MQVGQAAPLFLPVFPRQKFRMQVLMQALLPDGPQVSLQVLLPDGPQVSRASPGAFCTSAEAQVCDDVCAAEVQVCDDVCAAEVQNGVPHAHVQAEEEVVQAKGYKQHHQQYIRSSRQADSPKTEFSTFSCFVYSAAALPY